jgi:hypothetical protein
MSPFAYPCSLTSSRFFGLKSISAATSSLSELRSFGLSADEFSSAYLPSALRWSSETALAREQAPQLTLSMMRSLTNLSTTVDWSYRRRSSGFPKPSVPPSPRTSSRSFFGVIGRPLQPLCGYLAPSSPGSEGDIFGLPSLRGMGPPSVWTTTCPTSGGSIAWPVWRVTCIAFVGLDTARRPSSRHAALGRCSPRFLQLLARRPHAGLFLGPPAGTPTVRPQAAGSGYYPTLVCQQPSTTLTIGSRPSDPQPAGYSPARTALVRAVSFSSARGRHIGTPFARIRRAGASPGDGGPCSITHSR